MSEELRIRRRNRLRDKEAETMRATLSQALGGAAIWSSGAPVETAEVLERQVIVVDNELVGFLDGDEPILAVRGLLKWKPGETRAVTVDMGAVKFVTNGADIMAPGIVAADPTIEVGQWVWIRDERNKQPLAVGRALVPGAAMVRGRGKAVKSLHHLGDKLWVAQS